MSLLTLFLTTAAYAAGPDAPPPERSTVVVTAKRLSTTERELAACLARHCPPGEEIDAAIAHAENQFVAGQYTESRRTLLAARSRNARYAERIPVDVADLHRANARLASLNGFADQSRIGQIDSWATLKNGFSADDPQVLSQRLLVGDAFLKDYRLDGAREVYAEVAKRARRAGEFDVEGQALLRTAVLEAALAGVDPGYRVRARRAIARIEATREPELATFREAAAELRVQLDPAAAPHRATIASKAGDPPTLVYAPPIDYVYAPRSTLGLYLQYGSADPEWADVAFRIAADGTVFDVETLRTSDHFTGDWLNLARDALAKRRYRPLAPADSGMRRVERYSFFYDRARSTNSRVTSRANDAKIEITDLTAEPRQS